MEQTFHDLLRERAAEGRGLLAFALGLYLEIALGVIKEKIMFITVQKKDMAHVMLGTGLLLLIPMTAMQFSDEVTWTIRDFIFAGTLLMGAGFAYKLLSKKMDGLTYKLAAGLAVASSLFLIWANLAVGLIGSEDNPANLMYMAVLAVGLIGANLARFKPKPMSKTLFAMALVQGLIAVIAVGFGMHQYPGGSVSVMVNINGFFIVLFAVSGLLFRHAASNGSPQADQPLKVD